MSKEVKMVRECYQIMEKLGFLHRRLLARFGLHTSNLKRIANNECGCQSVTKSKIHKLHTFLQEALSIHNDAMKQLASI